MRASYYNNFLSPRYSIRRLRSILENVDRETRSRHRGHIGDRRPLSLGCCTRFQRATLVVQPTVERRAVEERKFGRLQREAHRLGVVGEVDAHLKIDVGEDGDAKFCVVVRKAHVNRQIGERERQMDVVGADCNAWQRQTANIRLILPHLT